MKRASSDVDAAGKCAEENVHKKKKRKKHRKDTAQCDMFPTQTSVAPGANPHEATDIAGEIIYPYLVDDADHCESPTEAYRHISCFLEQIAKILGKTKQELRVYDPYFCEGSMVRRLGELGFENVYNRKEDFYAVIAAGAIPAFDVLVTNPPYSGENVSKLMNFSLSCGKPFFLLMPNYVYEKDYYKELRSSFPAAFPGSMFYVSPKSRYLYTTPKGRRQQKSSKVTSPFPSFWYCSLGSAALAMHKDHVVGAAVRRSVGAEFTVAPSLSCLPLDVLADTDPRKKKYKNALKRKKHKNRKKQN